MLGVWMFGVELERIWGTRFFSYYYAITGLGGGVTMLLVSLLPFAATAPAYASVTIGASGALFGLLLAFALYYPDRPILIMMIFPVPARVFVMIFGAIALPQLVPAGPRHRRRGAPRRAGHRLPVPAERPRRPDRGDQIPLPEVEDEPPAPQVRRLLRRPVGLGRNVH